MLSRLNQDWDNFLRLNIHSITMNVCGKFWLKNKISLLTCFIRSKLDKKSKILNGFFSLLRLKKKLQEKPKTDEFKFYPHLQRLERKRQWISY